MVLAIKMANASLVKWLARDYACFFFCFTHDPAERAIDTSDYGAGTHSHIIKFQDIIRDYSAISRSFSPTLSGNAYNCVYDWYIMTKM